ncbi:MAG TPA: 7TM diverse intracellular signaling domain-containing protein [Spirochaetota bacterium]|nr:7TM diverse intracellular signaling domain-containing protein [Spirochaetota bacterium]HRS76311.1 7TM diverse intracellular signaling domain-containing protein [Spirochaetota bacterium]
MIWPGRNKSKQPVTAAISRLCTICVSVIVLIASSNSPLFSTPLSISDSFTSQKMGGHLDFYLDPGGKAVISDMSSKHIQGRFRPLPKEDYSFGFTRAAVWLRATIVNRSNHDISWLLECSYPLIDDICFYAPEGSGHATICTGDRRSFTARPHDYRTFLFPVATPPGEKVYYIRINTSGSLNISFTAYSPQALQKHQAHESILLWMYYGIMAALFLYHLFIYVSVRESSYLFLSLFTLSISLHSMSYNGLAFQYLWPGMPEWGNIANIVMANFVDVFAILFTRAFLETRSSIPRFDRFLLIITAIVVATLALPFMLDYNFAAPVIAFQTGAILVILILCGVIMTAKGSRQAMFYVAAWISLLFGALLLVFHSFGLIHEGFLSTWGVQIGSSLMVILLSLGIADKINAMRRDREQALEDTREAEEKYRALIDTTDTGYVIIDGRGRVLDANAEYVRLTGHLTLDDIMGKSVTDWTSPADRERNAAAVEACMRQGFIRDLEISYIQPDGKTVPIEINATVIDSKAGSRILTLCRDITYRKTVFDNLQASLREKEVLLMEIHHRVKNNLQIISSLIALQAGKITDREVLMLYEDLNSRIKAMSLIHERLYQSGDFARIDFAEYITIITSDLQNTYRLFCGNCTVEYDTDHIELDIVKAIPCGLMLNEIISNSFKYAFPSSFSGQGKIRISFHELDNNTIELIVGDNGVGLPRSIDPEKIKSLGLSLIYLLADQIQGTIRIDREGGTKYTVLFNKT